MESRVPRIGGDSGWSSQRASMNSSWATSVGSSSFMLISSSTTWRSESISSWRKAGRSSISDRISTASGMSTLRSLAQ